MPLYLQNLGFIDATGLFINPTQVLAMAPVTGTNAVGNDMTFQAGPGTGSGLGGSFEFQVADAGTSGSSQNALSTALAIASDKSITAYGDLTVSGDLTVNGTMTTVDSNTVTVSDPVFYLAKGQYSDTSTKLDRGILADYNDGGNNKLMFFGYDRTQDLFTFIPDATDSTAADGLLDGNFTGTPGAAKFGDLTIGSGSATGVLQSNGNYNLKLQTGNATTGYIQIIDGEDGDIEILPNGTGRIILGSASSSALQQNADSVSITAVQGVSIGAGAASNFTVTAANAGDDFTIAQAGSNDSSLILSSSGTGADALQLTASAGGMELTSAKTMAIATSANDANVSITAHGTGAVTMANRRLIVNDTNIRDSMEHVEIVPCDTSVFGSANLAPLVMATAPYNGWNANNAHATSSLIDWTIAPAASLVMGSVEFVTVCVKLTSASILPIFKVTINGDAYTFTRKSDATALSDNDVMQFVMPVSGTYSSTSPANKYGHGREELECDLTAASGNLSDMTISVDLGTFNFIVNSVNFVTNTDVGTLSYKFTNDSVVQAQSAQAVSALYNYFFNKSVSQTTADLIDQTSITGYIGTSSNYGNANVIANYTLRSIAYSSINYNISSSAASGTVVAVAPTESNFSATSYSMTTVSGLSINSTDGEITTNGETLTVGTNNITVTGTDNNSQTATYNIVVVVTA